MATPPKPLPLKETEEAIQQAREAVQRYDFIRFTLSDMNGIPRGCLVPGDVAPASVAGGVAYYSGLIGFGSSNELLKFPEVAEARFGNVRLVPDLASLHIVPWVGDGKYSTAQFLGETHWDPNMPQEPCPRNLARRMLANLDDIGLEFFSGTEEEFILLDRKTKEPVFDGNDFSVWLIQCEFDLWMCDVQKNMKKAGVPLERMHTEYSSGQFEFTTVPQIGIKAADGSFILKQGIKEMAMQRGWDANFMAQTVSKGCGNGKHFNFSLWKKGSEKENALWDANGINKLSEIGHHWLGGMIKHAKALTAVCCITINCYKRLHKPWTPDKANWGIEDRFTMVRVKNDGPAGTYFENRLPSGLANTYLVMAAIIAAGIDGIVNKIPCPEPSNTSDAEVLPHSLADALKALQEDEVMVKTLGEDFVKWFVQLKTETDLKYMEGITDEADELEIHVKRYSKLC